MKLTKEIRNKLVELNEGLSITTQYKAKNIRETRTYQIMNGALCVRAKGRTSWADSHYDKEWIADEEETHRFLKQNLSALNKGDLE